MPMCNGARQTRTSINQPPKKCALEIDTTNNHINQSTYIYRKLFLNPASITGAWKCTDTSFYALWWFANQPPRECVCLRNKQATPNCANKAPAFTENVH